MVWVARWSRFDDGRVEEGLDGYEVSTTVLLRLGQFYSRYDTILAYTRLLDAFCAWVDALLQCSTHQYAFFSERFSALLTTLRVPPHSACASEFPPPPFKLCASSESWSARVRRAAC
jgi:hypothetical protein